VSGSDVIGAFLLPLGLGLLGFIEPCSIGSSLLFLKYVDGQTVGEKVMQTVVFALTRAGFMGSLGMLAALIGGVVLDVQKAGWILLGALYVILGIMYGTGAAGSLKRRVGPALERASAAGGAVGLGLLFGLNVPACAAPLLFAVLGSAAVRSGTGLPGIGAGFLSLALFGLALSLPLVLMVAWPAARRLLDRLSTWSARAPVWIGSLLVVVGLWSLYFGVFVTLKP